MEMRVWSMGEADKRPEWDYKPGEWVEVLAHGEILGTGQVVDPRFPGSKYVRVRMNGVVEPYAPGELRRIK